MHLLSEPEHSRGPHDVGGAGKEESLGAVPVCRGDRELDLWEKRTDVIQCQLATNGLTSVDRLRHAIEKLEPDTYDGFSYYGKWAAGVLANLVEDKLLVPDDIEGAFGPTATSDSVAFAAGQSVRIKKESQGGLRWRKPHLRMPGYLFGCRGTVERVCGVFPNPEGKVFGVADCRQPLYRVRFSMSDIWRAYEGHEDDTCDVEVYQHWLEPDDGSGGGSKGAASSSSASTTKGHRTTTDLKDDAPLPKKPHLEDSHQHHGSRGHDHDHEEREAVEQKALDKEGEETALQRVAEALYRAVTAKGILTAMGIREGVEAMDRHEANIAGPRIVARAWTDPDFKDLLLRDPAAACLQLGVNSSNSTAPTVLTVVENTPEVHNLVVCTLCSCYPRSVLGMSPDWYKSRSYRARAVLEPRAVLEEFGTRIAPSVTVRVHDSTADLRYMVLPFALKAQRGGRRRTSQGW